MLTELMDHAARHVMEELKQEAALAAILHLLMEEISALDLQKKVLPAIRLSALVSACCVVL